MLVNHLPQRRLRRAANKPITMAISNPTANEPADSVSHGANLYLNGQSGLLLYNHDAVPKNLLRVSGDSSRNRLSGNCTTKRITIKLALSMAALSHSAR